MRVPVVALAILLAGCSAPAAEVEPTPDAVLEGDAGADASRGPTPAPTPKRPTPTPEPTPTQTSVAPHADPPPAAPGPVAMRFALRADRSIALLQPGETIPTEERVPEPVSGADFATGLPQGLAFQPFVSPTTLHAFEIVDAFTLTLRFVASSPAIAALPSEAGAPTIGVWFAAGDRHLAFLTSDVPTVLMPDEVHTVELTVPKAEGGILIRQGEPIVIKSYLSYQTADGSKVSWVVGGDDPAGFELQALPVDVGAAGGTIVLDETADAAPSPAFTANDPQPSTFDFEVPAGTRYLAASLEGTPEAGATMDMDLTLLQDGEVVGGSYGPYAREMVVLGPGALAALDASTLTARVVSGTSPAGGTFTLVVTAYA